MLVIICFINDNLISFSSKQVFQVVKVLFKNQSDSLSIQTIVSEVAIIDLIIHAYSEVTIREVDNGGQSHQ